ncbi:B3 domain-containing protein, partial [Trifolium medium]|nr:B3 domain-containing protein [Trifolium medium]
MATKRKNIFSVTDDVCLCLSLGGSHACRFPSCCETFHQTHFAKKPKLALQGNNICNVGAAVPVARRARNWAFSTALVLYDDPWRIKKVLTQSDLGNNCNILIKRELAKDLIVPVLGG